MASGNVYLYLKTHKIGGTTIATMLTRALHEQGVATCDGPAPANGTCAACLWHETLREIGVYARNVYAARGVHARGAHSGRRCLPLVRAPPIAIVRTALVMREPIDRMWAMYHYTRDNGWCQRRTAARNRTCAADVLPFLEWAKPTDREIVASRLERQDKVRITCETTATLSGMLGEPALKIAMRVLRGLTVVGVTERLDDFVILLAKEWRLPLPLLAKHYGHANAHTVPRAAVSHADRTTLFANHPMLHYEQQLYHEAARLAAERVRDAQGLYDMRRSLASLMPRALPQGRL